MVIEAMRISDQKVLFTMDSNNTDVTGQACVEYFRLHKPIDKRGFMVDSTIVIYEKE